MVFTRERENQKNLCLSAFICGKSVFEFKTTNSQ